MDALKDSVLRVAGVIEESIVDGPGLRFVLFLQGCRAHCKGCQNPQTWDFEGGTLVPAGDILSRIQGDPLVHGITFSGGEPFEQAVELLPLAAELKRRGYHLMAFSGRNFWAALIGLTVPYWFYGGYCALTGNTAYIMTHFAANAWVAPPAWQADISISGIATISFTLLVTLIGSAHFLRNSYKDKIRTRMIYEMLISMSAFTIVFMALQPQHAAMLTGIQIINASPLAAHFIALTNTRLTNITFCLLAIAALAITAFNILTGGAI